MLAALAGIRTRQAHVGNPALVDIHRTDDQRAGRQFDPELASLLINQFGEGQLDFLDFT